MSASKYKKAVFLTAAVCFLLLFSTPASAAAARKSFTISFAGDCTLGEYKGQSAGGQFKDYFGQYGPDYFFEKVRPVFRADDLTVVNLEGPLTGHEQSVEKEFPIRGDAANIACLENAGIEICNLSNNHIFDCGQEGFDETRALLDTAGISFCGEGYQAVREIPLDHYTAKIGFAGYQVWGGTADRTLAAMRTEIPLLKETCDLVIVCCHGGTEGSHDSTARQETVYRAAVDAGADMVIGTHPHVLEGIEKYKGRIIAYSLGNFCFGGNKSPKDMETCILRQKFRLENDQIVFDETTVIPCRISSEKGRNNFQPEPLRGSEEGNTILSHLRSYSAKYAESIFTD